MRAYFEEGCDIGDPEELVRLGAEVGLDRGARSATYSYCGSGQDGVVAAERHAAVLGITGVPTFVFDGQYTISGAQEVGDFRPGVRSGGRIRHRLEACLRERRRADRAGAHSLSRPGRSDCMLHAQVVAPFLNLRRAAIGHGYRSQRH